MCNLLRHLCTSVALQLITRCYSEVWEEGGGGGGGGDLRRYKLSTVTKATVLTLPMSFSLAPVRQNHPAWYTFII